MTHPACELCRGACCRTIVLPLDIGRISNSDRRYFRLRGRLEGSTLRVNAPCMLLTEEGRCGEYSARPDACRTYPVGGDACVAAIKAHHVRPDAEQILRLL